MLHAFVTSLPVPLARRNKPESEIRAEAKQRGLSKADEDREGYRNHHFFSQALKRLLTDNRHWVLAFEDHPSNGESMSLNSWAALSFRSFVNSF
ncbi:MAG: hypothetical protein ACREO5_07425 [Candidatus Binatia bacterium]